MSIRTEDYLTTEPREPGQRIGPRIVDDVRALKAIRARLYDARAWPWAHTPSLSPGDRARLDRALEELAAVVNQLTETVGKRYAREVLG